MALKKLDQRGKLPARIRAFSVGIVSALLLGMGIVSHHRRSRQRRRPVFGLGIVAGVMGNRRHHLCCAGRAADSFVQSGCPYAARDRGMRFGYAKR